MRWKAGSEKGRLFLSGDAVFNRIKISAIAPSASLCDKSPVPDEKTTPILQSIFY
jgi:hypothetical protein